MTTDRVTRLTQANRAAPQANPVITAKVISVRTSRNTDSKLFLVTCPGCGQTHRHILAGTRFAGCGARFELVIP